jgi:hypothetical protein
MVQDKSVSVYVSDNTSFINMENAISEVQIFDISGRTPTNGNTNISRHFAFPLIFNDFANHNIM